MLRISVRFKPITHFLTGVIAIISWAHLMFLGSDTDFFAMIFVPVLFFGATYLINGIVLLWNFENLHENELETSQTQERLQGFFPVFFVLTIIIFSVTVITFPESLPRYIFYYDKFLVWIFYNF